MRDLKRLVEPGFPSTVDPHILVDEIRAIRRRQKIAGMHDFDCDMLGGDVIKRSDLVGANFATGIWVECTCWLKREWDDSRGD